MAIAKGINSYATVSEADSYFEDRLDAAAWSSASEDIKAKALVTASQMLNGMNWFGIAVSESQTLAFPRTGSYFETRTGSQMPLNPIPQRIIVANYELAYHLLNNDGLLDDTGQVESIGISSIDIKKIRSASKINSYVRSLIRPLLAGAGSNSWWRAN